MSTPRERFNTRLDAVLGHVLDAGESVRAEAVTTAQVQATLAISYAILALCEKIEEVGTDWKSEETEQQRKDMQDYLREHQSSRGRPPIPD